MTEKNYYKILGVSKESGQDEIKKAFRQLARKYHPDVNPGNKESEEKFKEINEAYQVLGDEGKKSTYDNLGSSAFNQGGYKQYHNTQFNFDDLFSEMGYDDIFNIFNGARNQSREEYMEGADLRYDLEITLQEAFSGTLKNIEIPIHETCKKCKGFGAEEKYLKVCDKCKGEGKIRIAQRGGFMQFVSIVSCDKCRGFGKISSKYCDECEGRGKIKNIQKIELKIPRGINHGQYLRMEGKGESGKNAPAGDLYVVIHIKKHPSFKREDENLFSEKNIDLSTAIFGGNVDVEGIDKKIKLKIPSGTQSHTTFRLERQGMPFVDSNKRGDLFINLLVDIPKPENREEIVLSKFNKMQNSGDENESGSFNEDKVDNIIDKIKSRIRKKK